MSTKKLGIVAGVFFALVVAVTPVIAACDLQNPSQCTNEQLVALIQGLLGGSSTPTGTTGVITGIPAGFQFATNLSQGSTGNDVKYLQILLNADGNTQVAISGAGSPGNETTYFGPATKAAVIKFQNKYASEVLAPYGLTTGTGYFGTTSRTKANEIIVAGTSPVAEFPAGCTSTSGFSTVTGLPCSGGSSVTLPAGCTSTAGYSPTTGQKCDSTTGTTPVSGAFSVTLASDNPASGTLVETQAAADLMHFLVSNGTSSEVKITAIELTRLGVSADATLSSVYLFEGASRLTDAGTVSSGKVTFNNANGVITIPANSSKTISVKSDIAASSSGQTIGIAVSGVTASTTLSGTLPINGNLHTIASATLATVAVGAPLPTLTSPVVATPTDPIAGVRIWESTFTVNNRNVNFTKLSLRQINSINSSDVANFKLVVDGAEVATVASLDANGYVTFTFEKVLQTGTRNVKVLADINGGSSRQIQMSLRNKADIDVKDSEYNVNVSVTGAPATANPLSVNEGVFTITADNTSLPVTVANNASNVLIGKWKFKATGEAVKVETLTAEFDETGIGGVPVLRNGKIMIDGVQYGSTTGLSSAVTGTAYTINYTFQPGVETVVELYADIYNSEASGAAIAPTDTITVKLVAGTANATKQTSLGTIGVPTAAQITGAPSSLITVGSAGATLVTTPSYGTQNTVLPRTAFKIGSWTLTAGTTENINVNNLNFVIAEVAGAGATQFDEADMSDMYVVYSVAGGSNVTSSTRPTPIASNDFPVSFELGKTQTATIELYSSLLSGAVDVDDSVRATLTVTGTGAQSGVAAAVTGSPAAGQEIVSKAASLTISRDASTPAAALVSGNGAVKTVSYKLESLNDDYNVLQFIIGISDATSVVSASLKEGSTVIQTITGVSTAVTFSIPFNVYANTPKVLDVELTLGSIGFGMGVTGANVTTTFTSALIRPVSTGTAAAYAGTAPADGNAIYVYKGVPTITLETLPSTLLTAGTKTLQKFTVGSATSTTNWKQVMFSLTRSNGPTIDNCNGAVCTGLKLYQGGVEVPGTMYASGNLTAAGANTITVKFIPDNEEQVGVGTSKTYELKATNVSGTVTAGHYISTSITNPSVTKTASAPFARYGTTPTTLRYYAAGATVAANDIRQTAVPKFTTVDVVAAADVTGHNSAAKITEAYGITGDITLTLPEWTTDNVINGATLTVTGAGATGLTCTPYTGIAQTGAVTTQVTQFSAIQSVGCTGTGKSLKISGITVANDTGANTSNPGLVIVITKEATDYATGDVVVATDSDFGIALTGTPVAPTGSFIWSDLSALSHSIVTADWATDYLVKNLATDAQTVQGQ